MKGGEQMPDEELDKILERIFNKGEEEKEMKYFVTISQGSNKLELTADSKYVINQLVDYINDINKNSDAKLSFRFDPIKED